MRETPTVTRGIRFSRSVTLAAIAERLAVEVSLPFFYDLGLSWLIKEHPIFRLRGGNEI